MYKNKHTLNPYNKRSLMNLTCCCCGSSWIQNQQLKDNKDKLRKTTQSTFDLKQQHMCKKLSTHKL